MPWDTVTAGAAVVIAALAFMSDRWFRRREGLSRLLERFESAGFYVLVWRGEYVTRPAGGGADSLIRVNLAELGKMRMDASDARRMTQLLAAGDVDRAGMHEIYFFALRTHAWLSETPFLRRRMVGLLNDTFGFQLLSTFLDHRILACRLRRPDRPASYYAVQYGCLDPVYRDLVDRLAADFLSLRRRQSPRGELQKPLRAKWEATNARLDELLRENAA